MYTITFNNTFTDFTDFSIQSLSEIDRFDSAYREQATKNQQPVNIKASLQIPKLKFDLL